MFQDVIFATFLDLESFEFFPEKIAGGFWTKFEAQLAQPCKVLES
jgi:hypothetical protein